ncbi:hypothetical protein EJB05_10377 [Eragrostis curvula]|uniref:non-specific serine/threonine protein kinase n=1 Tax=Eragrostis curvula TaxID=38414 RepID=A0A5J9VNM1_9POAL|nr:hypothetical protein EJB05_10377 [Eragrostis curvula]
MDICFPCLGGGNKRKKPVDKPQIPPASDKPKLDLSSSVMKQDLMEVKKEAAKKDILNNASENHQIAAQTFTFRELAAATNNFRADCLLGEGGFGRVYKGYLESVNQVVAIKQLDRNGLQGNREFLVEVLMLSLLHHPNLVNLIGYCADGDQRLLVYEYMPLGSLEDHLHDPFPDKARLDWNTRMKIAAGAARGLEYLHDKASPPVIYRDLKCSNILLGEGYNPKLSDFGLAKLGPVGDKTHVSTRVMGTYGYCAPEYAMTGQLTLKSDIYSFGVVLLEIITGRRAIDNSRAAGEQNLVAWARPLFKDRRKFPLMADPALDGQYPSRGLYQALAVAAMRAALSCPLSLLRFTLFLQATSIRFNGNGGVATNLRPARAQKEEVLPPSLGSSSHPSNVFDGTTRLYVSYICPYAQRVWIARNYKVPVLEHNGNIIAESLDLLKYIEANFEGAKLLLDVVPCLRQAALGDSISDLAGPSLERLKSPWDVSRMDLFSWGSP